ncbi:hypothetical protein HRR83_002450 [Exophiala dermatitidis]|nr:hypothetical protein HRR74_002527 [Exophiala dermatitidis]KAJ4525398.1 hypothetical protein HRR73_002127 [Exophiala dermatitidis]KAJ4536713.1 hypothetical protein HRR76_004739 [Exophiala dermatitidis]KAJ4555684.1 hypothetical protein HRR77_001614 [Exophiala dermatitidis]KAJ4568987.1 hypothetical protein HRR81_006645 [Exophiala dermatitidis]
MASLTMAADGTAGNNALLPTSPVKEILTTKNANIPPQITHLHVPLLTPTQQKLLRKREDIVETRKDDEVPSMENRAMNYMERVIAQHRLAWDSKVALEPAEKSESGREMPLNPHQLFTDSPDLLAVTDVPEDTVHCSKPETPAFAKETPHCNTPLGHIDSSPPVSPIEFTSSPVPQEEAQEAASASERASSLAEDLHSGGSLSPTYAENSSTDAAKLQAPGAVGVRAYDQAAGNDHEPKIGQDETGKQTKQGGEDREHSTFFKSWGSPAARNKPGKRYPRIRLHFSLRIRKSQAYHRPWWPSRYCRLHLRPISHTRRFYRDNEAVLQQLGRHSYGIHNVHLRRRLRQILRQVSQRDWSPS